MIVLITVLLLLVLILIIFLNRFNIVSVLNSHFGSNLSTQESDNIQKSRNIISEMYENQINNFYNDSPYKTNVEPDKIPSIDLKDLTQDKFIQLTNNFTTPLVVKRFCKDTPAVQKWNLDYFINNYGKTQIPVIKKGSIDNHKNYIKNKQAEEYENISVADFCKSVKNGGQMYANNISKIFAIHPELLDNMNLNEIEKYTGVDMTGEIHITNLFIGGKGTGTSLHCSITGNFFYNVKGNKKWYLIHPKYSKYMKPMLSRTGLFAVSYLDICKAKQGDYVLNLPRYEIVLDEGDLLFNPPWWWHAITNQSEYTIACANRFTNFWAGFKNNPLFTIIFFSHPIANYNDFDGGAKTREEANIHFEKSLLADILKNENKIK